MSFDYDKLKKKSEQGNQWASYSDLFMVLSVVFLLLYVTASLRTGTHTLQQQILNERLAQKAQDLENQIKVYNSLKDNYLEKQASISEQQVYEKLMGKITLLKEENNQEASALRAKALENEKKEEALNEYQQIVRNIINANVLSKSRLRRKDSFIAVQKDTITEQVKTIETKDLTISEKEKTISEKMREIANLDNEVLEKKNIILEKDKVIEEKKEILREKQKLITNLNRDIEEKKTQIQLNQNKISSINNDLKKQMKSLELEKKKRKISAKNYRIRMARIKKQSEKEISLLNQKNKQITKKLVVVSSKVENANKQLENANTTILSQKEQKENLDRELKKMVVKVADTRSQFEKTKKQFQAQITDLKSEKKVLEEQRIALGREQDKLRKEKDLLTKQNDKLALQKVELAQKKNQLEMQKNELASINQQLADVNNQLASDNSQLDTIKNKLLEDKARLNNEKQKLNAKNSNLSVELKKAQETINAKKQLAKSIISNFSKAGIKADVNEETGEVVLSFGKSFFDIGRSNLKTEMKKALNKFMPIYSESISNDPKVASKIKSVDIVGFASPTYGGRYVNPNSLDPKDRKAIEYNTNLSIERAKSVFNHIIDTNKLKYSLQRKITPLLKVSGRSYFSGANNRAGIK